MPAARLIPDHIETTVHITLPPEVSALISDLHHDREAIGYGGAILLACIVALTLRHTLSRKKE
jgi:hypothetical protein